MKTEKNAETLLIDEISMEVPEKILKKFSTLVRESGSEDEKISAHFLANFLEEWGVTHQVHYPNLYLSIPKKANLEIIHPISKVINAKTPSFSVSTAEEWVSGEVVYIPSKHASKISDIFSASLIEKDYGDLTGKIVITEGYPMSGKVKEFNDKHVVGAIFISPGDNIHDGICTSIWGTPDLDSIDNEPKIPVLAVNKESGEEIKSLCGKGKVKIKFQTNLDNGWYPCPLIDIFIEGTEEPEKYVLLHGHLDSWTVGIGDNATGDAALLEIARILYKHRDKLKRSIRIAIWPGHSTGRYAGSTWFADQNGLDLDKNCIAQVNCDSPGCRWATSYENINWMSEVEAFCKQAIKDATGQEASGSRPRRSGDYSFNNIGITSFYKLSSTIPDELIKEKNYYPVGGCGGNIEWHTEDDLLYVADMDILKKDIRVYLTSVFRISNETIHPINFVKTADEIIATIKQYQEEASDHFRLDLALEQAIKLRLALLDFYDQLSEIKERQVTDPVVKEANEKILKLGRVLIPVNYTRTGKFRHDPALEVPPLPDIEPAKSLKNLPVGSHRYNITLNHLLRGQNRLVWTLQQAQEIIG
ncbi:M28 family peptidase [Bacillus timonensis]|uniref:M28 family peptidase n=1 Tax=Bacillus timonensis TaxID=1033734 RepID=A0A4S3PQR3_9BACI|nr:M28 family peptidase [Bacillus timonensis]THE11858.1 M28 family peptidase [Bacillus timonensis]